MHIKKVADVRNWLREAFEGGSSEKLRKYRVRSFDYSPASISHSSQRILVLTGPAGTAKSSTIKVLGKEMNLEILEWRNSMGDTFTNAQGTARS